MTTKEIAPIWNSYLQAYGNVSTEDRERLLAQSVTDNVISINPGDECQGMEALIKHIEVFQTRIAGAYFKANKLQVHHHHLLSEWTLFKGDVAIATGHTHAQINDKGLITDLCGFF
jgi:ketosteroid isomerase-like protein